MTDLLDEIAEYVRIAATRRPPATSARRAMGAESGCRQREATSVTGAGVEPRGVAR